jgi:RNA polymerase sigma factor (sigma-70 family)
MPYLTEDRARLAAFRAGEVAALTAVYRHYAPGLFTFLRGGFEITGKGGRGFFRGMSDLGAQENIVQEVFARAFTERARLSYDGLRPYGAFLNTIARNLVVDQLRQGNRVFVSWEESEQRDVEPTFGIEAPDAGLDQRELQQAVRAFVEALGGAEREVLELRFRGGLSLADTVAKTGLTDYRVKVLEARIRKRFFAHMRARGFLEGSSENDVQLALWLLWAVVEVGARAA